MAKLTDGKEGKGRKRLASETMSPVELRQALIECDGDYAFEGHRRSQLKRELRKITILFELKEAKMYSDVSRLMNDKGTEAQKKSKMRLKYLADYKKYYKDVIELEHAIENSLVLKDSIKMRSDNFRSVLSSLKSELDRLGG